MSEETIRIAQLIILFWPLWLIATAAIMLRIGARRRKTLGRSVRRGILAAWLLVLLPAWVLAWFGPPPAPGLLAEPWNSVVFLGGLLVLLAIELAPVLKQWNQIFGLSTLERLRQVHAIEELNALTPTQFEQLVQDTYRRLGYSARHMGKSGDHGVDLDVITPDGEHWVVQCKRWRGSVGEGTVRELYGTLLHEGADRAVMVTSAEITPPAEAWARGKPIDLIDGSALLKMIDRARSASQPPAFERFARWVTSRFPQRLPPPTCPNCRLPMVQRPRRPSDPIRRRTYRCANYPACRVVIARHQ